MITYDRLHDGRSTTPDPRARRARSGRARAHRRRDRRAPSGGLPDVALENADPATIAAFRARAEAELETPWPQPRAHDAARFHLDGDRIWWEHPAFARQHRLTRVAVLAAATGEDRWIDETLDGAIMLSEQSSWCWPAHDDTRARHGSVLATVTDPYVDLGAGEAVGQLAWLDHIAGDVVEARYPAFRARLAHEARVRVLDPFVARRDWRWIDFGGRVNNWNPWIHGNVIAAALQFLDGDERARVVSLAIEGMDLNVASLPEDGAIDEGYAYWWNGACRLVEALDLIAHATGLDATGQIAAVRETIAFPHRMHLGEKWFVNAADGQASPAGSAALARPAPRRAPHRRRDGGILRGAPPGSIDERGRGVRGPRPRRARNRGCRLARGRPGRGSAARAHLAAVDADAHRAGRNRIRRRPGVRREGRAQ